MLKITKYWYTDNIIKEYLDNLRDIPCSWTVSLNIIKISILQKLSYRFISIPLKIPGISAEDIDKLILKLTWKGKGTWIVKTFWTRQKKKKGGESTRAGFKTYYYAVIDQDNMKFVNG